MWARIRICTYVYTYKRIHIGTYTYMSIIYVHIYTYMYTLAHIASYMFVYLSDVGAMHIVLLPRGIRRLWLRVQDLGLRVYQGSGRFQNKTLIIYKMKFTEIYYT